MKSGKKLGTPCTNKNTCAAAIFGKIFATSSISHDAKTKGAVRVGKLKRLVIVPMKAVTTEEKAVANNMTKKLTHEPLKGDMGHRNPRKTPITANDVKVPLKP